MSDTKDDTKPNVVDDDDDEQDVPAVRPRMIRQDSLSKLQNSNKLHVAEEANGPQHEKEPEIDEHGFLIYRGPTATRLPRNRASIRAVRIHASVTLIPDKAFYGCNNMRTVVFDEQCRLKALGQFAFYECESLQVVQNLALTQCPVIGEYAFSGCKSLRVLQLPETVRHLEEGTFSDCVNLYSVLVSPKARLQSLGLYAFYGCQNLTQLLLPKQQFAPRNVGDEALEGCDTLTSLCPSNLNLVEFLLYRYNNLTLHSLCYSPSVTDLEILVFQRQIDLKDGCDMNPLHILAINPAIAIQQESATTLIQSLLQHSQNPVQLLLGQDVQGRTPLHYAAINSMTDWNLIKELMFGYEKRKQKEKVEGKIEKGEDQKKAIESQHMSGTDDGANIQDDDTAAQDTSRIVAIEDKQQKSATALAIDCDRPATLIQLMYQYHPVVSPNELAMDNIKASKLLKDLASRYISQQLIDKVTTRRRISNKNDDSGTFLDAAEQHGWVRFASHVNQDDLVKKLIKFIQVCESHVAQALAQAQDFRGQKAVDVAVPPIRQALQTALLLYGRYDLNLQLASNDVCLVYQGTDVRAQNNKQGKTEALLCFYRQSEPFHNELTSRYENYMADYELTNLEQRFDSDYVVPVLSVHNGGLEKSVEVEAMKSELPLYCLVTEQQESLFQLIHSQQLLPHDNDKVKNALLIRHVLFDLLLCLDHMHQKGFVHSSLTTKNIVCEGAAKKVSPSKVAAASRKHISVHGRRWRLTNLQGSVEIGTPLRIEDDGSTSILCTAYLPPEVIHTTHKDAAELQSIAADTSLDIWAYGCVMFELITGRLHFLNDFGVDVRGNMDKYGLRRLHSWSETDALDKLACLDDEDYNEYAGAKDLLLDIFAKKPEHRLSVSEILEDDFFAHPRRFLELQKMLEANSENPVVQDEIAKEMKDHLESSAPLTQLNSSHRTGRDEKRGYFHNLYRQFRGRSVSRSRSRSRNRDRSESRGKYRRPSVGHPNRSLNGSDHNSPPEAGPSGGYLPTRYRATRRASVGARPSSPRLLGRSPARQRDTAASPRVSSKSHGHGRRRPSIDHASKRRPSIEFFSSRKGGGSSNQTPKKTSKSRHHKKSSSRAESEETEQEQSELWSGIENMPSADPDPPTPESMGSPSQQYSYKSKSKKQWRRNSIL